LGMLALVLVRTHLWEHREALGLGGVAGGLCGRLYWRRLHRTIARRDRRYERNKIFVHYLSIVELAIGAVAYNHYLALPLGLALLAGVLLTHLSHPWWTILVSSSGFAGGGGAAGSFVPGRPPQRPPSLPIHNPGWSR